MAHNHPPVLTGADFAVGDLVVWARPWAAAAWSTDFLNRYGHGPFEVTAKNPGGASPCGILLNLRRTDGTEGALQGFDPGWFIKA